MSRTSRTAVLTAALLVAAAAPAGAGAAQAATSHTHTEANHTATRPAAHVRPAHPHGPRHLIRDPSGKLVHALGRGHIHPLTGQSGGPPAATTSGSSLGGAGCTFQTPGYTTHYCHAGASQSPWAEGYFSAGVTASTPVYAPYVASSDFHSLWEIAVEDSTEKQIIEVGWRVYGPDGPDPRLFVNDWVNGVSQGYNNIYFNLVSTPQYYTPGMTLPTGTTPKQFGIEYYQGNWWISYDNSWFGYFSGSDWGGTWTNNDVTQIFGEVAAGELYPCTDMGAGVFPGYPDAAHVTNVAWYGGGPPVNLQKGNVEDPLLYDAWIDTSGTGFTYGGPGNNC